MIPGNQVSQLVIVTLAALLVIRTSFFTVFCRYLRSTRQSCLPFSQTGTVIDQDDIHRSGEERKEKQF